MARTDPYRNFQFQIEIEGVRVGGFSEVTGLCVETEVIEYRDGQDQAIVKKLPGLTKFSNVVLKRGITQDLELWHWLSKVAEGRVERKNVRIRLLNPAGDPVMGWNLLNAWPVKWEGPSLNAKGSETAMETLEISHEGVSIENFSRKRDGRGK